MEILEREFNNYITDILSRGHTFCCTIISNKGGYLAWYTALRVAEMIKEYFSNEKININLCIKLENVIDKLKQKQKNDVLLISVDNPNIKSLSAYLVGESFKKNLIFIGKIQNELISPFIDITMTLIRVFKLKNKKIQCTIEINKKESRELELKLPNRKLITIYNDLYMNSLKENLKRQT